MRIGQPITRGHAHPCEELAAFLRAYPGYSSQNGMRLCATALTWLLDTQSDDPQRLADVAVQHYGAPPLTIPQPPPSTPARLAGVVARHVLPNPSATDVALESVKIMMLWGMPEPRAVKLVAARLYVTIDYGPEYPSGCRVLTELAQAYPAHAKAVERPAACSFYAADGAVLPFPTAPR